MKASMLTQSRLSGLDIEDILEQTFVLQAKTKNFLKTKELESLKELLVPTVD